MADSPRARRKPDAPATPRPRSRWTVSVSEFGKVRRADIEFSPFMLLVGKNNTGKSYIATLLWALLNARTTFLSSGYRVPRAPIPDWFKDAFSATVDDKAADKEVAAGDKLKSVAEFINVALDGGKKVFFNELLSYPNIAPKSLSVEFTTTCAEPFFKVASSSKDSRSLEWGVDTKGVKESLQVRLIGGEADQTLERRVFSVLAASALNGRKVFDSSAVYIPAARTGLMLAYPLLVSSLLESLGVQRRSKATSRLSLPTIRFLQQFTEREKLRKVPDGLLSVAQYLEDNIAGGVVSSSNEQVPEFSYRPHHMKEELPLHVTSSMITELAPFLLLLKSGRCDGGIIFEEPEAHLHISAQRVMAKALARLINLGVPVIITTHSDTFVQQINNLMHIHQHPNRKKLMKKFSLEDADLIDPECATAYEFTEGRAGTSVERLKAVREGFIVPSLNDTLASLADETFAAQEDGGD